MFGLALAPLLAVTPVRGQTAAPVLPAGGIVAAGAASIATAGSTLTVTQASAKAIVAWDAFSIGQGGTVRIENGAGATLNRVTGGSVSAIDGLLSAPGSVYLINPNGVVIGTSGVVDVGGTFVAATLGLDDGAFMAGGDLDFAGSSGATVINLGRVGALGGDVALIARTVSNMGTVAAANGTAGLLAGTDVLLRDAALDDGRFVVRAGGAGTSATNAGTIAAAAAELRAAGGNVYALAGDTAGVIRATGVTQRDGRIFLTAGDGGTTSIAGKLVARGTAGAGGAIETSGGTVVIGAAGIDAGVGGTWLVDPTDLAIDQTAANTIASSLNAGTNVTQATSAAGTGGSGDISVSPSVALNWSTGASLTLSAYRNITLGTGATLASTGGGAVTLYADNTGTGTGAVTFGSGAGVSTAGAVNIYYDTLVNPAVSGGGAYSAYKLVNNVADLQAINSALSGSFALGRDIDAAGVAFVPIGTTGDYKITYFTGVLDGQGHAIANLSINPVAGRDPYFYVGLFQATGAGASIRNLALVGGSISVSYIGNGGSTAFPYALGALVGDNEGGTISNVSSSLSVRGVQAQAVGGLVGIQGSGSIVNSSSTGSVASDNLRYATLTGRVCCTYIYTTLIGNNAGGIAGTNAGSIVNSFATGFVSSGGNAGGLVATNSGSIRNSYTIGTTTGDGAVGGVVGANSGTVANAYASGAVSGGDTSGGFVGSNSGAIGGAWASGAVTGGRTTGGFAGANANGGTITDGYWDETTTGQLLGYGTNAGTITRLVGLAGNTGYSAYAQSSYTHFTFGTGGTWFMVDGATRPILQSEYSTSIATAHQLQLMAMNLGAGYTLGGNIDASETSSASGLWNPATGFVPVGTRTSRFTGMLDGQGHVVSGLSINSSAPGGGGVGLFGSVDSGGAVRALGLTRASIRSGSTNSVGALVGENYGALDNVSATADVGRTSVADMGYGDNIGGLVGYNFGNITNATFSGTVSNNSGVAYVGIGGLVGQSGGGTLKNVSATATIAAGGARYAGGLIGYAASTTVSLAYSSGSVTDGYVAGGLIGGTSSSNVANSYSLSSVAGQNLGILGGLVGDSEGAITNVYASGLVTSNGARFVGGLVGYGGNAAITGAYYDVGTTGQASGLGYRSGSAPVSINAVGGSSGNNPYAASSYAALDFSAYGPWAILEGSTRPILRSEYSTTITTAHQLQLIALNPYVDYTLGADLNLGVTGNASEVWNPAVGFTPIGSANAPFTGAFRGSGHMIANLTVARPGVDDVGLFAGLGNTGAVTNLTLASVNVAGATNVGGLAGYSTGTISRVAVSGTVSATNSAGGLVGYNLGSVGGGATSTATVGATNFAGGLVGYNAGTLTGTAAASVRASDSYAGGLAGYSDANGRIAGQVTGGAVSAANYAGGLAGFSGGSVTGSAGATTAAGTVSAARGAAGLVAFNTGTIVNASSAAAVTTPDLGGGLVAVNFGTVSGGTASGAVSGGTQLGGLIGANVGGQTGGGVVTASNATGVVSGTGTLGGLVGYNDGTIGASFATGSVGAAGANFVGGLIGYNARTVGGSYATGAVTGATWVGGLAGYSDTQGRIANSGASGPVSGADYAGGLAGFNGGAIDSSNTSATVSASDRGAGGLVGYNTGSVTAAYATGRVATPGLGGGLAGVNFGTVARSFATAAVSGAGDSFGGLAGVNAGTISESYATGAVSGGTRVGGAAGYDSGGLANIYATGAVAGADAGATGGLVGYLDVGGAVAGGYASGALARGGGVTGTNNGTLTATFYDVGTTGAASPVALGSATGATAVGGTTGRSATAQGSYAGLNFLDTWTIREGQSRPYLQNNPQNPIPQ